MELNKIAAAILLAGLVGMITGKVSTILYYGGGHHDDEHAKRGYEIEVVEDAGASTGAPAEEKLASIIPLLSSADVAEGEKYFSKKCATCHTVDNGGKNMTGPNLWNIVDRGKGSVSGFNYSSAMKDHGGKWGYDELNGFLHKPKKYMPGTIMAFAGIKKDEERANLIAYLRSQSSSPAAIPKVEAPAPATEDVPAEATPTAE